MPADANKVTLPTVVEALSAVMGDVQSIGKGDRNTQQNYNFRGIDAVVNAVGPALRKHGVLVVPAGAVCDAEHYQTKSGTPMRGVTLTVTFRFYGPAGDSIDATVCGEASDSGDKAVPKAHSVAYRTLLLQALCIPTNEPDPDSESHERAKFVPPPAVRQELATDTQRETLSHLAGELEQAGKVTREQLDQACRKLGYADFEIGAAALSAKEAESLIGRLERYRVNAGAPA